MMAKARHAMALLLGICTLPITLPIRFFYRLLGFEYFFSASQSVWPTARVFSYPKSRLVILGGELGDKVWDQKRTRAAFTKLVNKNDPVDIEIVLGPEGAADPETLTWLKSLAAKDNTELRLYVLDKRPVRHFMVADSRYVRIEDPHPPNSDFRTGYVVTSVKLAKTLETRFDLVKQDARLLAP